MTGDGLASTLNLGGGGETQTAGSDVKFSRRLKDWTSTGCRCRNTASYIGVLQACIIASRMPSRLREPGARRRTPSLVAACLWCGNVTRYTSLCASFSSPLSVCSRHQVCMHCFPRSRFAGLCTESDIANAPSRANAVSTKAKSTCNRHLRIWERSDCAVVFQLSRRSVDVTVVVKFPRKNYSRR